MHSDTEISTNSLIFVNNDRAELMGTQQQTNNPERLMLIILSFCRNSQL